MAKLKKSLHQRIKLQLESCSLQVIQELPERFSQSPKQEKYFLKTLTIFRDIVPDSKFFPSIYQAWNMAGPTARRNRQTVRNLNFFYPAKAELSYFVQCHQFDFSNTESYRRTYVGGYLLRKTILRWEQDLQEHGAGKTQIQLARPSGTVEDVTRGSRDINRPQKHQCALSMLLLMFQAPQILTFFKIGSNYFNTDIKWFRKSKSLILKQKLPF